MDNSRIRCICWQAFLIRIFVLLVIFLFKSSLGEYFMPNDVLHDDVKYIEGAVAYEESANSLFDIMAFASAMAQVGQYTELNSENGWFALCAGFLYLFHSQWLLRLLNIIFAVISVFLLYKLTRQIFNERVALLSAKLLTFLPYPVLFCCFPFKDQFVMMCLLFCLISIVEFLKKGQFSKMGLFCFFTVMVIIHFTRKGLDVLILIILIVNYLFGSSFISRNKKALFILLLSIFLVCYGGMMMDDVSHKILTYMAGRDLSGSRLFSVISINQIWDIWKFPISYAFVILLPLDFNQPFSSWYGILSHINIVMIPIAISSFIMLFKIKKNKILCVSLLIPYLAVIVMSTMIFRHYFCLLPIAIMLFSQYWDTMSHKNKRWVYSCSMMLLCFLIFYF